LAAKVMAMAGGGEPTTITSSSHREVILDCAYNFYGNRLATCAADRTIQVWDQVADEPAGRMKTQWTKQTERFERHTAPVYKLDWAHPEFGQVLASCSADRTVIIWEEQQNRSRQSKWLLRSQLVDSRSPVVDVKFAPRHLGLRVATASLDGCVRTYEAVDVMNLAYWPLCDEFLVDPGKGTKVNCLAWNPSRVDPEMLVVGSNSTDASQPVGQRTTSKISVWCYDKENSKWEQLFELSKQTATEIETGAGGADGAGDDGVRCVDWAPKMGRTMHHIAAAVQDKVYIWKLSDADVKGQLDKLGQKDVRKMPKVTIAKQDEAEKAWRVSWNVTGTTLASSGDDGKVRLYKCPPDKDVWTCWCNISPPKPE